MRQSRSKLSVLSELPVSKGFGLRGKMSDAVSLRSNTHGKLAMGVGHRSFGARAGKSFVTDAPCRLAFDEFSPQRCSETVNSDLDVWQLDERSGTAAAALSPFDTTKRVDNDAMPSLLPCKSPKVGSFIELGSNWEGFGFRGKMSDAVYPRSSTHDKLAMGVGHRSFGAREGRSLANVAPCRLAFDEFSPQSCSDNVNSDLDVWQWDERSATAAAGLSPSNLDVWQWDERSGTAAAGLSPSDMALRNPSDALLSPLPCKSPEVCTRSFTDWGLNWEDNVAQEWFQSRDRASFGTFSESSNKTPEAQPSKSPELSKRAMAGPAPANAPGSAAGDAGPSPQQTPSPQTPSPQPTNSPEFLKRSSVPPSSGGCFGAGPLMGPEGTSVKDRRKCKPRGILTIESELLFGSGSSNFEELQISETIPVPALASVEWMVAEGGGGPELASVEWMLAESYDASESGEMVLASPGSISEEPFSVPYHGTFLLDASFATY